MNLPGKGTHAAILGAATALSRRSDPAGGLSSGQAQLTPIWFRASRT